MRRVKSLLCNHFILGLEHSLSWWDGINLLWINCYYSWWNYTWCLVVCDLSSSGSLVTVVKWPPKLWSSQVISTHCQWWSSKKKICIIRLGNFSPSLTVFVQVQLRIAIRYLVKVIVIPPDQTVTWYTQWVMVKNLMGRLVQWIFYLFPSGKT